MDTTPPTERLVRAAADRLGSLRAVAAAAKMDPSTLSGILGGHTKLSADACLRLWKVIEAGALEDVIRDYGGGKA